jgi:hypothetical protein
MIKIVGLILLLTFNVYALVPVEGILMGEAKEEIQSDPLKAIFSDIYDKTKAGENKKVKLYFSTYESGSRLFESCSYLAAPTYGTPWQEKQAKRSMAATLQFIGLDTTIKAIGAYARRLEISEDNYKTLKSNLVRNYCSKNVTILSLRNIEKSLEYYYANPLKDIIPSVETSPFAPKAAKMMSEKATSRSKEFDLVLRNFRAFCSWGTEVEDYRMLSPYLNNRFIMAFVIKNMSGVQDQIDEKEFKVVTRPSASTVQVGCKDLVCRKEPTHAGFKNLFPMSIGSTGLFTDLSKLYCHHFRYQDYPQQTIPEVKAWIKSSELEEPVFETSQFISLMTGVPDFMNAVDAYQDVPLLAKSSIDERWTQWSNSVLTSFSRDLLFEESLKVKVEPQDDLAELSSKGFIIDFSVTLGEMDRILKDNDKIQMIFELKLSKNYIRALRTKSLLLEADVDEEGKKVFRDEVGRYIDIQLREKEKLFSQKMWNEEFSRLIADELIRQTRLYRGPLFNSYQDEVLRVPVKFSYGLFALSYLRYRADVAAGRLKLKL